MIFIWKHQKVYGIYRDEPTLDDNKNIIDFPDDDDDDDDNNNNNNNNNTISFKFKAKISRQTRNGSTKDIKIMVPFENPKNFWKTLQLKWSAKCILVAGSAANQLPIFTINDTNVMLQS